MISIICQETATPHRNSPPRPLSYASHMSRKSSIATLKALSRQKIVSADDYVRVIVGIHELDDRSFALVQGAMVEFALETALQRSMRTLNTEDANSLFTGFGPLSTFSAKILVGYAFQIFGIRARSDLEKVKEIRNAFAHSLMPLSFEQEQVANVCRLFYGPTRWEDVDPTADPPRLLFFLACGWLWSNLFIGDKPPLP